MKYFTAQCYSEYEHFQQAVELDEPLKIVYRWVNIWGSRGAAGFRTEGASLDQCSAGRQSDRVSTLLEISKDQFEMLYNMYRMKNR